jgi:hypothetical protein
MMNLDRIGEDLFNKIRGRFPSVTIGDEQGNVTNDPEKARFFDFDYKDLGKVSVSVAEDTGLTVIYSKDFIADEDSLTQKEWYTFLKELRVFSKKRMLDFSVRDINKSNLNKRDYKFLANRSGDKEMNESKLYGTARVSYQNVDNARLVIKHTENINQELPTGRAQKIGAIYVESSEGERFKYPYRHLSGARAMARHVSEGGKPYDDFGKHIVGLSEELAKLRKFKTYMGRSSVMAETLEGYMDVVKERIGTVRKTIESLQKPAAYKEAFDSFETPVFEEVPDDIAENWIDQLTIKQFNEELKDVFPYIYRLVSEATKAKTLGPEDLDEAGKLKGGGDDPCWKGYKMVGTKKKGGKEVPNCVPEEIELERGFEEMMGQFGEATHQFKKGDKVRFKGQDDVFIIYNLAAQGDDPNTVYLQEPGKTATQAASTSSLEPVEEQGFKRGEQVKYVGKHAKDLGDIVTYRRPDMREPDKHWIETKSGPFQVSSNELKKAEGKIVSIPEDEMDPDGRIQASIEKFLATNPKDGDDLQAFHHKAISAKNKELDDYLTFLYDYVADQTGAGGTEEAGVYDEMLDMLHQMIADKGHSEGNAFAHAVRKAKMDGMKKGDKVQGPDGDEITLEKEAKTPLGEFILSYYDRETGTFPKGETAVLTMVEKDYGEQFIEPAKAFIEQVNQTFEQFQMRSQSQQLETDSEFDRMRELAGLR